MITLTHNRNTHCSYIFTDIYTHYTTLNNHTKPHNLHTSKNHIFRLLIYFSFVNLKYYVAVITSSRRFYFVVIIYIFLPCLSTNFPLFKCDILCTNLCFTVEENKQIIIVLYIQIY